MSFEIPVIPLVGGYDVVDPASKIKPQKSRIESDMPGLFILQPGDHIIQAKRYKVLWEDIVNAEFRNETFVYVKQMAKRDDGKRGYIPKDFIEELLNYPAFEFYTGPIRRFVGLDNIVGFKELGDGVEETGCYDECIQFSPLSLVEQDRYTQAFNYLKCEAEKKK